MNPIRFHKNGIADIENLYFSDIACHLQLQPENLKIPILVIGKLVLILSSFFQFFINQASLSVIKNT